MRGARSYDRRGPTREPYDVILIVCEGNKTEPLYLERLRTKHRLSNANIRITPADGTDPMSIVKFAEGECRKQDYDRVYCVFDRDDHTTYDAALMRIATLPKFTAITSWPCFEIWLLLHFAYSSAPKTRAEAFNDVRKAYQSYTKGCKTVFDDLESQLIAAIANAKRLAKENHVSGSSNPSTRVHELVEYLISLKR